MSVTSAGKKTQDLEARLRGMERVVVAFSGGVDSAFLAAVAHRVLGEGVLAVTAYAPLYPQHERREAAELARALGLAHRLIPSRALENPAVAANDRERCYHCKRGLFRDIAALALRDGYRAVVDGTTADDLTDDRPGLRACREIGICSPLLDTGFTKREIREESRRMGLPTADKPSGACLATRIPYGTPLTVARLGAVERVEDALRAQGLRQVRARHHGALVRIELAEDARAWLEDRTRRAAVVRAARAAGFRYVTVDLESYRTGRMNEDGMES
jgi:pyridinium-3,5-biscarboxylic acid mononucleotide sulfurtransferase